MRDYIKLLSDHFSPKWNMYAAKANKIREKRNLIHTKLCLQRVETISESDCQEIVDDLKKIIASRKTLS